MLKFKQFGFIFIIAILFSAGSVFGQTTAFVYQGKLTDGAVAANGTYQFEFKLYDAASGGNQIGQTIQDLPATVTNGIFAVNLDFGASSFDGSSRYLEIAVRLNGSGQPYTLLNPRQVVTSTPYAVKSLKSDQAITATTSGNSLNLGGVPAAQYVVTTDSRMSDARNPLPNSTYYIQNSTNPQTSSNFNISGEGKAGKFTAVTQFNIGSDRILSAPGSGNLFAGINAGTSNTANGTNNSFFGRNAGTSNTTGNSNAFFGRNSGFGNTTGSSNSFFGNAAGQSNESGSNNTFLGGAAGLLNTSGNFNVFIGSNSAFSNTSGSNNTFIGYNAGSSVTNGTNNIFIGSNSGSTGNVFNSIAIGTNVKVASSNTAQIGTSDTDVKMPGDVEIGKTAVIGSNLTVSSGNLTVSNGSINASSGNITNMFTAGTFQGKQTNTTNLLVNVFSVLNGTTNIQHLKLLESDAGGETDFLCIGEDDNLVKRCIGFLASMQSVTDFRGGLETIKNLRAVTFNEPGTNHQSVGLTPADGQNVSSLFLNRDKSGAANGVKYIGVITALVGATQEQQTQIERQQEQIKQQQSQIAALKALVCQTNPTAAVCQK